MKGWKELSLTPQDIQASQAQSGRPESLLSDEAAEVLWVLETMPRHFSVNKGTRISDKS